MSWMKKLTVKFASKMLEMIASDLNGSKNLSWYEAKAHYWMITPLSKIVRTKEK